MFPRAWVFETGTNQWRKFDAWPPKAAKSASLFFGPQGTLTWERPATAQNDEYLADPNRPVPYIGHVGSGVRPDYMTEDQRFAATRPDVLVYKSPVLEQDVTVMGPIGVDLKVSTSGTDADFVVKLIDVYPADLSGVLHVHLPVRLRTFEILLVGVRKRAHIKEEFIAIDGAVVKRQGRLGLAGLFIAGLN